MRYAWREYELLKFQFSWENLAPIESYRKIAGAVFSPELYRFQNQKQKEIASAKGASEENLGYFELGPQKFT